MSPVFSWNLVKCVQILNMLHIDIMVNEDESKLSPLCSQTPVKCVPHALSVSCRLFPELNIMILMFKSWICRQIVKVSQF
jgi:hypothetical protein